MEKAFEELTVKNSSKVDKNIRPRIQETKQNPCAKKINTKLRHIIKMLKKKILILKAVRE